jgi:NTP pyrophosphatase (non-canonical NTP hydrolase)
MFVDEYQRRAVGSDQSRGRDTARFLLLGLFGEAGSLLSAVKKRERDTETTSKYLSQVSEEIGDLLWYIAAVSDRNGVKLSDLALPILKTEVSLASKIQFSHLQSSVRKTSVHPSKYLEYRLVKLASAVGVLVNEQTKSLHTRTKSSASEAFTDVFRLIAEVATRVGISLNDVAEENLSKITSRWPERRQFPGPFDNGYPLYEQLPRKMTINMEEIVTSSGQYFVRQTSHGIHIGDRLTDNIEDPDEYRFHDVFHYAYIAVLGWSPVMRSLLRLKRKSNKIVDESEDGARAVLIEEGISALVFNEAKRQDFFREVKRGKLSFDLLKAIASFVQGYEVQRLPLWLWEEAILQGFEAFRYLQDHRAARIVIDYRRRRLDISPHP